MTPEQVSYVRGELQHGQSPEAVAATLRENGYNETQIAQLLEAAKQPEGTPLPPQAGEEKTPLWVIILIIIVVGVIAIGAIIVPTVLSSLNDARETSRDALAKQVVSNSRAQAELYFNVNGQTYEGFCDGSEASSLFSRAEAENYSVECKDAPEAYRASVELLSGRYYCVDSETFAGELADRPSGLSCQ